MRKFTCVAIDDNELDRLTLHHYLSRFPDIYILGIFESPAHAIGSLNKEKIDILFLDIDMPGMSGLEVREKYGEIPVCVFTTDHPEFALESFNLETLDYLLKPYSFERFSLTMDRIYEFLAIKEKASLYENLNSENILLIKEGHEKVKVNINDILYLKTLQNYTVAVGAHNKWYILAALRTMLEEDTNFESFIRTHRSYAVNKRHIRSFNSKEVTLNDDIKIPVGRSYKKEVLTLEF